MRTNMPKIALGAWSWGAGAAGGDQVFGNHMTEQELKPVFEKAMELGDKAHVNTLREWEKEMV